MMEESFEQLCARFEPMISATLRKLHIYNRRDEHRQAARIALWQAWTRCDEAKGHFNGYAARSIRGAMLDELKREGRRAAREVCFDQVEPSGDGEAAVELPEEVERALARLSEEDRRLLRLSVLDGWTCREVAARFSCSEEALKKRRQRLLARLRRLCAEERRGLYPPAPRVQ